MPGIVMVDTSPVFFKPRLCQLIFAMDLSSRGNSVTFCYPPVPHPTRRRSEGMKPLDNKRKILRCYEAFKLIVGI
jgi:hypothetical protein